MFRHSAGKFPACLFHIRCNLYNKSYKPHFCYQILGERPFINLFNLLSLKNANFMLVSLQIDENFSDVGSIYGNKNQGT